MLRRSLCGVIDGRSHEGGCLPAKHRHRWQCVCNYALECGAGGAGLAEIGLKSERWSADGAEFALLLNQFGDETGPAGLMRCAEPGADVAVKIFVKQVMMRAIERRL